MKSKVYFLGAFLLIGILLGGGVTKGFAGSGGADDPLVTKSYVLEQINKVAEEVKSYYNSSSNTNSIKESSSSYVWKVSELAPGKVLEAKAGTEIIVRAGTAVLLDPIGSGVPDITTGSNLKAGSVISLNHQLIFPRSDGRGFICQGNKSVIVMHKGEILIY